MYLLSDVAGCCISLFRRAAVKGKQKWHKLSTTVPHVITPYVPVSPSFGRKVHNFVIETQRSKYLCFSALNSFCRAAFIFGSVPESAMLVFPAHRPI
jgi:hypothetical protein